MKTNLRVVLAFLLLVLLASLPAAGAGAQAPPPPEGCDGESPNVYRIAYATRAELDSVARRFDVWEVDREREEVVAQLLPGEAAALERAGMRVELDPVKSVLLNRSLTPLPDQSSGIPGYPCYRTVEETYATAEGLVAGYPQLATWTDIGDSWEKTADPGAGYDLMVLRLTNSAIGGTKPKLFVMASMHARELTPAELTTRFAESLLGAYDNDADVTWLLDYHEIHLLLQANPDGRKQAETGLSWRKNTNENYCSPTSNYRGADLNRNYAFQWGCCGGSSGYPCDLTYRGPSPASEPETQAVQEYVRAQFPDQREDDLDDPAPADATGVFLDVHSYGQLVLWSWGFTYDVAPNGAALQTLGRKFAYFNGYEPQQSVGLYPTDGTTDDFAYGELGLAAYTFELGTSFFQSCSYFENSILDENLEALLYAAKAARAPYQTPAGPDALDPAVDLVAVPRGAPFELTATLDDGRYNQNYGTEPTQDVAAAEYYVDVPPWATSSPTPQAMEAADGAFDEVVEEVSATVDSTSLAEGRHTLFVRGQDADGNWGPFSAVFVEVLPPAGPPSFTVGKTPSRPRVEAGTPLSYTLMVANAGGYASGVAVTDTLPANTEFAWADGGGAFDGDAVTWRDLSLPSGESLTMTYGVTLSCVTSGTQVVNDAYHVTAAEWPTPTAGLPVSVTAQARGVTAAFDFPTPALADWPLAFANLSANATAFEWDFGDGGRATEEHPRHAYAALGAFTTTLTATNACSADVTSRQVEVHTYDLELAGSAPARGDPATTVTHTLRLTNTGTLSDLFRLTPEQDGWAVSPESHTLSLAPGEGEGVSFWVEIPAAAEGEESDVALVTARALSDPRSSPAQEGVYLTTVADTTHGVSLAPSRLVSYAAPGQGLAPSLRVTNTGNTLTTFTFSQTGWEWPTLFHPSSLTVAPGGVRAVEVHATVPLTAELGTYTTTLRATDPESLAEIEWVVEVRSWAYLPLLLRR